MSKGNVTVLGINGHIGQHAARAFVDAGWTVKGMGRSNKQGLAGVTFVKGDAQSVADMARAVEGSDVVVNALNLPYDKWFNGAMEAQTAKVIAALGTSGKTLLYPGNIYNVAASLRQVTPDAPQHPERPRGEIRVRCEAMLKDAAVRGDIKVIIVRAGDYFGPGSHGDWFDQGILATKGKIAAPAALNMPHSWAYLPDIGRAFEKLAWHRDELGAYENFHFAGHFVTSGDLVAAIQKASPTPLKVTTLSWGLLGVVGLFNPVMREVAKMHYLWLNPMQLMDARLDAILGPDFGTPYDEAIAATVAPLSRWRSRRREGLRAGSRPGGSIVSPPLRGVIKGGGGPQPQRLLPTPTRLPPPSPQGGGVIEPPLLGCVSSRGRTHYPNPSSRRTSSALHPAARRSRRLVDARDFASFLPSSSRIRR